jgi:hypothetical protein
MPSTYEPIETTTLVSSQATVSFSSFGGYTDLVLVINGTVSGSSNTLIRFGNGSIDSGSNYSNTLLYGTGSGSGGTERVSNQTRADLGNMYTGAQNTIIAHIMNYANTTTNKTYLARANTASQIVEAAVGLWRSTAAITNMELSLLSSHTFSAGTSFTLYGIKAA